MGEKSRAFCRRLNGQFSLLLAQNYSKGDVFYAYLVKQIHLLKGVESWKG